MFGRYETFARYIEHPIYLILNTYADPPTMSETVKPNLQNEKVESERGGSRFFLLNAIVFDPTSGIF